MIDEKTITEATELNFDKVTKPKLKACLKYGFLRGVEWFKNTLWHEAKEEPEEGEQILYIVIDEDEVVDAKVTMTALYDFIPWNEVVSDFNISKWCYLADLQPKGSKK